MAEEKTVETFKTFENEETLRDKDLITYYKLRLLEIKQKQRLLGNFTDDGKYVFSPEIKKALVKIKKLITSSDETSFFAQVAISSVVLSFRVNTWVAGSDAIANLYLDEKFSEDRQIQSFVAQYVAEYDSTFLDRVKKVFNLFEEVDELELDEESPIKEEVLKCEKEFEAKSYIFEIEAQYMMLEIMEKLKKGGEKEKQLLQILERQLEIEKLKPEGRFVYINLKHFFEHELLKNKNFAQFFEQNKDLQKSMKGYVRDIEVFDEAAKKIAKPIETKAKTAAPKKAKGASYKPPKIRAPYKYKPQKAKKAKPAKKDKPKDFLGLPKKSAQAEKPAPAPKPKPAPAVIAPKSDKEKNLESLLKGLSEQLRDENSLQPEKEKNLDNMLKGLSEQLREEKTASQSLERTL